MTTREVKFANEWGSIEVGFLGPRDLTFLERLGGRISVSATARGHVLHTTSFVGVVQLESCEVRIEPKLTGSTLDLVRMIEWSAGLEVLRKQRGISETLQYGGGSLLDLLGMLMVEASEAILRRGLLGDYVDEEEDLPVVRGRIQLVRQLTRRMGRVDRVCCRFDDYSRKVDDNRLLARGLRIAAQRCTAEDVRRRARSLHHALEIDCDLAEDAMAGPVPSIEYHRLNHHYRWGHELARVLAEGQGVTEIIAGERGCFAFLLGMNRLFERFVERLVSTLARRRGVGMQTQAPDGAVIYDLDARTSYATIRPDLLLSWGEAKNVRLAVDAKYKRFDNGIAQADVYQAFLYAHAYAVEGATPQTLLLFPASGDEVVITRLAILTAAAQSQARITAMGVPIPRVLDEIHTGSEGAVSRAVWRQIEEGGLREPARS